MNLGQIRTKTRYFLDDDNSGTGQNVRWTDTEINSYINEAYRFYYNELMAHNYDGITKTITMDLVSDDENVELPEDWAKTRIIYRVGSDFDIPLQYGRNYDSYITKTGAGTSGYTPVYDYAGDEDGNNSLVLYPRPSFSETGGLKMIYWPQMVELVNDADSPVFGFNVQWHDMIPLRSAIWAKGGREEEDVNNLSAMLKSSEDSFYNNIDKMTNARSYVESFDTGDFDGFGGGY